MEKLLIDYIRPDGQFDTANGTFFCFVYEFQGGLLGQANHKTSESPFSVGQEVYVEVVGSSPKGVKKLKLSKNPPDPRFSKGAAAPAPAGRPVTPLPQSAPASGGIHPATVGMAIKAACDLLKSETLDVEYLASVEFAEELYAVARNIARVAVRIETGAVPASKPAAPAAATKPAAPAPKPAEINDEDVPF